MFVRRTPRQATGLLLVAVLVLAAGATQAQATGEPDPAAGRAAASSSTLVAVDVAEAAGLGGPDTKTWSAAPFDYDRDGAQDVLIGYHPLEKLWRNQGEGSYRRVAVDAWPAADGIDRHSCAWADVDRNGLPDVYCSAGRGLKNWVKNDAKDNQLWLQTSAGEFTEVGTDWKVGDVCGRGRSVTFLRANGDRYPDLFVGNQTPRDVARDACDTSALLPDEKSKLFLNVDGRGFRRAPKMWPYGAGPGVRCAEVLDFDGDGWDDLLTCREPRTTPRLYRNLRGKGFRDVTSRHRLGVRINDATVVDLGRDGDPDVVTAAPDGFGYHPNRGGVLRERVLVSPVRTGAGTAIAVGDADGDGDLDFYGMVGNGMTGNPNDRILLNDRFRFTGVRVPAAGGSADDVVPLRRFRTGRVEFLALNGYNLQGRGPVQLIRLVRRTTVP